MFVANAGIAWYTGSILNEDSTPENWRRVFDVNVNGVFYCAKYAGEIFKRNGSGSFIITASMSAHINNVPNYQTCYNSAKAAVMHMAKGLAVELLVLLESILYPLVIQTPYYRNQYQNHKGQNGGV